MNMISQPSSIVEHPIRTVIPFEGTRARVNYNIYSAAWLKSMSTPNPNWLITINLPKEELAQHCRYPKGNVTNYLGQTLIERARKAIERKKQPWLWLSVIEVASRNYHAHVLAYFKSKKEIETALKPIWKQISQSIEHDFIFPEDIYKPNTGVPIHAKKISPREKHKTKQKKGVDGAISYIGKEIDKTYSRQTGLAIGKTVSTSRLITNLVQDRRFSRNQVSYIHIDQLPDGKKKNTPTLPTLNRVEFENPA